MSEVAQNPSKFYSIELRVSKIIKFYNQHKS